MPEKLEAGKDLILKHLDEVGGELVELSHKIHGKPELGYEEYSARDWQAELLRKHGFDVEVPYCGLETSYKASVKISDNGPRLAFLAEYDALPGVGHACGHNIIAASAVGAGIGLAYAMQEMQAMKEKSVAGEVLVLGTPGEEGKGGKIHLVEHGAFDGVDFAMMVHPSNQNVIGRGGLAAQGLTVRYRGKAVHSASPEKGINALSSLIALFNSIDMLRQVWPDTGRCNGIVTAGGQASNIVPDFAEAKFTVRAGKKKELAAMMEAIHGAAESAARLTGAEIELSDAPLFAERYPNRAMGELFKANMEFLGESIDYPNPLARVGSSDIGNVSMVVPSIHEYLSIAGGEVLGHTDAFREAACSPRGDRVVLLAAKGLAMTGWDLATDADKRAQVRKEFEEHALPNRC
ncbi:MAG: M20 family metallopeptidase [Synergistaceae bacterium]|nr:M20 family metallopeptidase [Synergistaceae bacterium]